MSTVICPHCGFNNFSISAYCSKCERPLSDTNAAAEPLPSASQVAQQIMQRRPPVPQAATPRTLPSAADVAAQLMQRRAIEDASAERTVVQRVPMPERRAQPPTRAVRADGHAPSQQPTRVAQVDRQTSQQPTRVAQIDRQAPQQPMRTALVEGHTATESRRALPVERAPIDREPLASDEPTAVFQTPTRPDLAVQRAAAPRGAAPSLPQPAMARGVMPVAHEPAPRAADARRSPFPDSPRTEPGVPASVLRQGATPPRRTAPQPPSAGYEYAAGWRILLGHFIDIALLALLFAAFASADAAIAGPKGLDAHGKVFEWIATHPGSTLRAFIITLLAGTAYHVVLAAHGGRTVGRMLAGTVLARRSGRPMSWFVVVLRTVVSYVSLAFFGAGFFWAIVDSRGRGFHDLVAGTMIVRYRS